MTNCVKYYNNNNIICVQMFNLSINIYIYIYILIYYLSNYIYPTNDWRNNNRYKRLSSVNVRAVKKKL